MRKDGVQGGDDDDGEDDRNEGDGCDDDTGADYDDGWDDCSEVIDVDGEEVMAVCDQQMPVVVVKSLPVKIFELLQQLEDAEISELDLPKW